MTDSRPGILAIDDTPENLLTLGAALATEFKLQIATSGAMGLTLAAKSPPDLILLDVMMPEMDGYETCRRLKSDSRLAGIPVIFVTALTDTTAETAGLALGAADFITKPINVEIARHRIRNLMEREQLRKAQERDIADRKQAEEDLQRSNAELEQFSYAISHDMRQPLRMISSYLKLIETDLADRLDGEQREYFNFVIDGAKRMDAMMVGLLEYSRVGRKGEPCAWLESRTVLDEALLFLEPAIAEASASVAVKGAWPRIFASPDEMLRLLQNLIGNALKFRISGRTPQIDMTSEMVDRTWRVCVADNGVGIIPGQIERLFQVFQRLQSRTAYEGTGIGLALCRKIVEHHGGTIWAESAGENQGSRFYFALPQNVTA
jgi:light-regulated signal transduction histidine kinase (bacteriophytochrome)